MADDVSVVASEPATTPTRSLGTRATRVHLVLVSAIALSGLALLAVIATGALAGDSYSRDMAVFGGLITAPAWIIGIVAAVDAARTLRGRPVSRRRALAWALLATLGGLYLMYSFGHVALVAALAGISSSAVVDWPSVAILSDDGMSADYVYLNDPTFWGPVVATVLGCASLLAQAKDRGAHPAETRTTT